ncbi:hypothetical protein HQN89_29865 [Paenibacillus frigoriresistens]|nr:hypothetical protein [Paenibacillus frigoriresistens]
MLGTDGVPLVPSIIWSDIHHRASDYIFGWCLYFLAGVRMLLKWVGLCGGTAGDALAVPLLIGLGLDKWSMNARSIVKIKHAISQNSSNDCRRLVC